MSKKITILDGGMGRFLEKIGAPFKQPEWSALSLIEAPEFVLKAHKAFIEAGAEIITTNSYALVPFHIGQERFDRHGRDLIALSGKLAKEAAMGTNVKIAGSLPPAFGSYRPDLFIEEKACDIYTVLVEELEQYVDFWLAETVSSTLEAKTIKNALKNSKKDFWLSYTIKDRENHTDSPQLRSGETIEKAVETSLELNAKAILLNCSQPEEIEPALKIIQEMNINIPYGAYANAFPAIKKGKLANAQITTLREDACPDNYLVFAKKWHNVGTTIIGGCCGIGPDHIRELNKLNL